MIAEILHEADATSYAAHFARHRVTWEVLRTITDTDLREVSDEDLLKRVCTTVYPPIKVATEPGLACNRFKPKNVQFQISPAASPEI